MAKKHSRRRRHGFREILGDGHCLPGRTSESESEDGSVQNWRAGGCPLSLYLAGATPSRARVLLEKNWVRTGRTELPVRPLARCRPRTIERRRLPTARGSVSSWRCSSAHFLFLVLSSLPFLHSSSFRSAADRDPWPEPPRIPITGAAVDPHHRSCSRSPSPEPPRCPLPAVPPLPRA